MIRTAIPYNGALSWKIYEWRRINDESSSKDNSDTNKEENEPEIFSGTETETETKTSENIRNSDTWELMQKTAICIISSMILPVTG